MMARNSLANRAKSGGTAALKKGIFDPQRLEMETPEVDVRRCYSLKHECLGVPYIS